MAVVVTVAKGYDLGYIWKTQGQASAARTPGGYYINAAQAGEPPGHWWGPGAQALGFTSGQVVERRPYEAVYQQRDPRTGDKLGRPRGRYATFADHLAQLTAAEPHATAERVIELEREAAQATRLPAAYTDVTVSFSKSISVLHASIRENARRALLAGDGRALAHWSGREQKFQEILHRANRAVLEYLQDWAGVTRTGYHGVRAAGQEPGRFAEAGLVVTSWLQGTSRDGDPQDHVHNQIARITRTVRDGQWRALDTASLRAVLGALQGVVATAVECELTREFGVAWVPRADGRGNEIRGVTQAQMDAYSTRTVQVHEKERELAQAWERAGHPQPGRRLRDDRQRQHAHPLQAAEEAALGRGPLCVVRDHGPRPPGPPHPQGRAGASLDRVRRRRPGRATAAHGHEERQEDRRGRLPHHQRPPRRSRHPGRLGPQPLGDREQAPLGPFSGGSPSCCMTLHGATRGRVLPLISPGVVLVAGRCSRRARERG